MKRSPLARRTPLRARSAKTSREARQWARLRTVVFARDGGCCVHCGVTLHAVYWECHHRKFRSHQGPDAPFNLVALCLESHRWAHSYRLESEPLGLVVPATEDPASIPVTYADGTVRLLAERAAA